MKQNLDGAVRHTHDVDIPVEDISDVLDKVTETAIFIIGAYAVADVLRHFLKR
jgi:hypothetical protein